MDEQDIKGFEDESITAMQDSVVLTHKAAGIIEAVNLARRAFGVQFDIRTNGKPIPPELGVTSFTDELSAIVADIVKGRIGDGGNGTRKKKKPTAKEMDNIRVEATTILVQRAVSGVLDGMLQAGQTCQTRATVLSGEATALARKAQQARAALVQKDPPEATPSSGKGKPTLVKG